MSAPEQKSAGGPLASILALPNDSNKKTLFMAVAVCLVCSIVVASAAVGLRPIQIANQEADRINNIVDVAGVAEPGQSPAEAFEEFVEARLIRLEDGTVSDAYDVSTFDIEQASKGPATSFTLDKAEDKANIKRQPTHMPVYIVRSPEGEIERLILPVHGAGLWSTLYGFLALESDLNTIGGLKFYQHAETPGLGGEIDNPNWRAIWEGKLAFDSANQPAIRLVKGGVDHSAPGNESKIDALAGATLTVRGVENLINFWLGEHGYGPFIERLRNERG